MSFDFVVLGAGAMGLSLAYELSLTGSVGVVEHAARRPASWAAGGMIVPASREEAHDCYHQLVAYSGELHAEWAQQLEAVSGESVEYRRCGGLHFARSEGEGAALAATVAQWRLDGVEVEPLATQQVSELEPALAQSADQFTRCYLVPAEAQVRPPRFLRALRTACEVRGVVFMASDAENGSTEIQPVLTQHRSGLEAVSIGPHVWTAGTYCIASGAWSSLILDRLGVHIELTPIRGQIALFGQTRIPLRRILNEGPNYFVPRRDGRVLVGSTVEEAGFDDRTTEEAIAQLVAFARGVIPELDHDVVERTWAGLRPKSGDGFPYMGAIPGLDNAYLVTGHYRSGILLAPATARVVAQMMRGEKPAIDITPFRVDRE